MIEDMSRDTERYGYQMKEAELLYPSQNHHSNIFVALHTDKIRFAFLVICFQ